MEVPLECWPVPDRKLGTPTSERREKRERETVMDQQALRRENKAYRGTMGVSQENYGRGFMPAFRDLTTGRVEFARFKNGMPAPVHLIEGLPTDWAVSMTSDGTVVEIKPGIISGFVRDSRFYTREEVIQVA